MIAPETRPLPPKIIPSRTCLENVDSNYAGKTFPEKANCLALSFTLILYDNPLPTLLGLPQWDRVHVRHTPLQLGERLLHPAHGVHANYWGGNHALLVRGAAPRHRARGLEGGGVRDHGEVLLPDGARSGTGAVRVPPVLGSQVRGKIQI